MNATFNSLADFVRTTEIQQNAAARTRAERLTEAVAAALDAIRAADRRTVTIAVLQFCRTRGLDETAVRANPIQLATALREHAQERAADDRRPLAEIDVEDLVDLADRCAEHHHF